MVAPNIIDKWLHVTQSGFAGVVRYSSRTMSPKAIFIHIQEGTNWGSWQHFHSVTASSTVLIGKNGDIWRLVPESLAPWTNGDVKSPTARGLALLNAYGWDPNRYALTIENEGFTGQPVTEAQMNSMVWQVQDWMQRYGLTVDDVYRHADVNSATRLRCPGDALFNELKQRLGAGVVVPAPTPVPTTIAIGDTVKATDILNVRQGSAITFPVQYQLLPDEQVKVKDGPRVEGGYTWYDVDHDSKGSGWAAANWMEEVAPAPLPAPVPDTDTGPVFHAFSPHRTFTVGKGSATVRKWASRESEVLVLRVLPNTEVVAIGYYLGESINGKNKWVVQRDEPRGRMHESAFVEQV